MLLQYIQQRLLSAALGIEEGTVAIHHIPLLIVVKVYEVLILTR